MSGPPAEDLVKQWESEQGRLRQQVVEEDTEDWQRSPDFCGLDRVGGVDLSFIKGNDINACSQLVVLSYPDFEELDVIPDVMRENTRCLVKEWNFIQLSVDCPHLSEVETLLSRLEATNQARLHPLVVIWVHLSSSDKPSIRAADPASIMDLSSAAKLRNILLYGIQIHQSKDAACWGRSVLRVAEITSALIRERSPALVGQLLQA